MHYVLPVLQLALCLLMMHWISQNRNVSYVLSSSPGGGTGVEVCHLRLHHVLFWHSSLLCVCVCDDADKPRCSGAVCEAAVDVAACWLADDRSCDHCRTSRLLCRWASAICTRSLEPFSVSRTVFKGFCSILKIIFTARRYASAVYDVVVCLSICLCVCHKPALYKNG